MLRKAVGVIIIFNNKEILLARRGMKEERESNKWENVGGEILEGESIKEGLRRELEEEIGKENLQLLEIEKEPVLQWTDKPKGEDEWEASIFIAKSKKKFKVVVDKDEDGFIDEVKWFMLFDLPWKEIASYCIEDYRRLKKKGVNPFATLNL